MAHLLGTQNVGALAGSRKLLEGVTVGLDDGSPVGLLGSGDDAQERRLSRAVGAEDADAAAVIEARRNPTGEW